MDNIKMILLVLPKTFYNFCCKKEQNNQDLNIYEVTKEKVLGVSNPVYEPGQDIQPLPRISRADSKASLEGSRTQVPQNIQSNPAISRADSRPSISESQIDNNDQTPYTWQGVFNCFLSFYQIKSLIVVNGSEVVQRSTVEYYINKVGWFLFLWLCQSSQIRIQFNTGST